MEKRSRVKKEKTTIKKGGNYFASVNKKGIDFIKSGCVLLDCVLGGGYPTGRITNIVGDKSTGKCVKNCYVSMTDKGLILLDDESKDKPLGQSNYVVDMSVRKGVKDRTSHFWKEKVTHTKKITTRHHFELEATLDHCITVWTSEHTFVLRSLKDLKKGDIAVIAKDTQSFSNDYLKITNLHPIKNISKNSSVKLPEHLDEDLGLLLGYIIADGNLTTGQVMIANKKQFVLKNINSIINKYKLKYSLTSAAINNSYFRNFMFNLLDEPEKFTARYKQVPALILRSPKKVQTAFLKGLFDCDGYYKKELEYYTASEILSNQIQLMLLNLGVLSSRNGKKGAVIGDIYYDHVYWTIRITKTDLNSYVKQIGSDKYNFLIQKNKIVRKSDFDSIPFLTSYLYKLKNELKEKVGWRANGTMKFYSGRFPRFLLSQLNEGCSFDTASNFIKTFEKFKDIVDFSLLEKIVNDGYHFDPVIKIKDIYEESEVYDVHIPENHLFWSNGFISHNTLLAIEACANFMNDYPDGSIWYNEVEAAFDIEYARSLGMPVDKITFVDGCLTVEDWYEDLEKIIEEIPKGKKGLYIIDSLDALSDRTELDRAIDASSFGANKAKQLSQLFRRLNQKVSKKNISIIVISQVRDNIGVTFGRKTTRSGGRALDFYASQVIYLAKIKALKKTRKGIERTTGVVIRAKCDKNKVGQPFRECDFEIVFGYGIDDSKASLDWLKSINNLGAVGLDESSLKSFLRRSDKDKQTDDDLLLLKQLPETIKSVWEAIETEFLPKKKKYT